MGNFINKLLAPVLQFFKAKTPKAFLAIATIATVLQFGLSAVVNLVIPGIELPPDFLSLHWIITATGLQVSDEVTSAILWFLALLTGSSSSAWLDPNKRADLVEESKLNAKEADVTRLELPPASKQEKIAQVKREKKALREARRATK